MHGHIRVLLVDDDERVLFVLQAALRRMNAAPEVVTAQDGLEAHQLLQALKFDLLITDIRLPGMDGIALTRLARAAAPSTPVLWITAHGCAGVQHEARLLGVRCCMEKPVEMEEFREIVRQALMLTQ